ncbi:hypothetical protein AVEN_162334-1, partial [Araneus ventricosus]
MQTNLSTHQSHVLPGAQGDHTEHGDGSSASREVGCLGPDPNRRGTLRHRQHLQ